MQSKEISVYISVTEPVEPLGSTLYLFSQLRLFGSVSDRYISDNPTTSTVILIMPIALEKASKEGVHLLYADG